MIYLFLSIISSSLIFVFFKWLGRLNSNALFVIVVNYFFAAGVGFIMTGSSFFQDLLKAPWIIPGILLGSAFLGMFYVMASATKKSGAAPAVVANKMSVVIPVIVAFVFLSEPVTIIKILGILLALVGIFMVTGKKKGSGTYKGNFELLLLLFMGSGAIDTSIKLIEQHYLDVTDIVLFTSCIFLTSFIIGIILIAIQKRAYFQSITTTHVLLGGGLGLVNFGSIYFLVQALKIPGFEASVLFPLNNIGVVILSTVLSILIFREHLSRINKWGVVVAVLALILLMLAV